MDAAMVHVIGDVLQSLGVMLASFLVWYLCPISIYGYAMASQFSIILLILFIYCFFYTTITSIVKSCYFVFSVDVALGLKLKNYYLLHPKPAKHNPNPKQPKP